MNIRKKDYIKMIKKRYISCLLKMTQREIKNGADEINLNYDDQIKFTELPDIRSVY